MIYIHNLLCGYVLENSYTKPKSNFLERIRIVGYECKSLIYYILYAPRDMTLTLNIYNIWLSRHVV
jgi:hypothetical protein